MSTAQINVKNKTVYYGYLSIAASLITLTLKFGAYHFSGSVGLLSDALESLINLAAGIFATFCLTISNKPPDKTHHYGHGKVDYIAGGFEGFLVIAAALGIFYTSVRRIINPVELGGLDIGVMIAVAAAAVNFITARIMLKASKKFDSLILEADAKHLMTDVWTSVGLVIGLVIILIGSNKLSILDPIIAILMSINIAYTGIKLVMAGVKDLLDQALPESEIDEINELIIKYDCCTAHSYKSRKSGSIKYIDFHLLVNNDMTVKCAHDLMCDIENSILKLKPNARVTIHVEPADDAKSFEA